MKSLIFSFLTFTLFAASLNLKAQYTISIDDVNFDNTNGEILKFLNQNEKDIIIPNSFIIEGVSVEIKKIGGWAFYDLGLTSVTFSENCNVEEFAEYAFYLNSISTITVPKSVRIIGNSAFERNLLKNVTFAPDINVSIIGKNAFTQNKIDSILIPASVTEIGYNAFNAIGLKHVEFKEHSNLSIIANYAFSSNNISTIHLPKGIKEIGMGAFARNQFSNIDLPSSLTKIGGGAFNQNRITKVNNKFSRGFIFKRKKDGSIDSTVIVSYGGIADTMDFMPDNILEIGDQSFTQVGLDSILLPDNVVIIGRSAFSGNSDKSIFIPKSVSIIKDRAFYYSLDSVTFEDSSQLRLLEREVFFHLGLDPVQFPKSSSIDNFRGWKEVNTYNPGENDGRIYQPGESFSIFGHAYKTLDSFQIVTLFFPDDTVYQHNATQYDGEVNFRIKNKEYKTNFGKLILFLSPGQYDYSASKLINGMTYSDTGSIVVNQDDIELDITLTKEVNTDVNQIGLNDIKYYPNPAINSITVVGNENDTQISLYNNLGELILQKEIRLFQNVVNLDLSNYKSGMYLIKVGEDVGKLFIIH